MAKLNRKLGKLVEEHLETFGPKRKISKALTEVLPYSISMINDSITAYSKGQIYGNTAFSTYKGCLTSDEARIRRDLILYSLGIEENSELISVLRELDPNTEYPPKDKFEQITAEQVQKQATLYQKIKTLSGPRRTEVEELVDRLYIKQIRE